MNKAARIYIAGHNGMVGSAIGRALKESGHTNLITRTRGDLDLTEQSAVREFFAYEKPSHVFLAAARVGGILANSNLPAEFIQENLLIQCNVIDAAYRSGVEKLLFLGSSCIYPKLAGQPMNEDCLLTGELEPTNEFYAIAKISGVKTCQAYRRQYGFNAISLMPANLYGYGDDFHPDNSHVIPALIRKFHRAKISDGKTVTIWGTGKPRREFLHVDDLASAAIHLMTHYDSEKIINIGTGEDITISELAELIADVVQFDGRIEYDPSMPDGTPQKLLDISRIRELGWHPRMDLRDGLVRTYRWYAENQNQCNDSVTA